MSYLCLHPTSTCNLPCLYRTSTPTSNLPLQPLHVLYDDEIDDDNDEIDDENDDDNDDNDDEIDDTYIIYTRIPRVYVYVRVADIDVVCGIRSSSSSSDLHVDYTHLGYLLPLSLPPIPCSYLFLLSFYPYPLPYPYP